MSNKHRTTNRKVPISIGIPVYNGENYIGKAIGSLLSQTFQDFEIVISDNASTDATSEIVRSFTERDPRIRYFRNARNIGAQPNFNRVFELANGEYFHWHGHDDLCAPTYLEKCAVVLDRNPDVVLCHSRTLSIDEHEEPLAFDAKLHALVDRGGRFRIALPDEHYAEGPDPVVRFEEALLKTFACQQLLGLMRANVARGTGLLAPYYSSDRAFLIEMALKGQFREVPEPLFLRRVHPNASGMLSSLTEQGRWASSMPGWTNRFYNIHAYARIAGAVLRSDMDVGQKLRCLTFAIRKTARRWAGMPITPLREPVGPRNTG